MMEEQAQSFDVCIVCALHEEVSAVIETVETHCGVSVAQGWSQSSHYAYSWTTICNHREEPLRVVMLALPKPGPIQAAMDLKPLLQEFRPRFVAMTGICAGLRGQVQLGDLVVVETAYHYEEGKIVSEHDGQARQQPAPTMDHPTDLVLQYAQGFSHWQPLVKQLQQQLFPEATPPKVHVAAMASSIAVRADAPLSRLREHYHRQTVALDMEAASFYHALRAFPTMHGLVVKGVCDYADSQKDDTYHAYAARASALYILAFLQAYVSEQMMVRQESDRAVWTVPFPRYPFFTGQERLLTQLSHLLRSKRRAALTQPQAITGLGGIGKTQIAVEYAWQQKGKYPYVLWSRADTHEVLVSGYVALAEFLSLPEKGEKDQLRIVKAVVRWLGKQTGWLLILDNVDDLRLLNDFLPPERQGGHLLLTTRAQATGEWAHPLEVETMPPDVGATLLLRRARLIEPDAYLEAASPADASLARALSQELGGLPLALDQAGAYIEETQCNLTHYQELYRSQPSSLLKRRGGSTSDYPASVATTWSLSFERVEQQNPEAAELLRYCAFLHPDAIPTELFKQGAAHLGSTLQQVGRDPLAFDEAVRVLRSYSLIRRDPQTATLSIHRLVQAVLLDTMPGTSRGEWQDRVIQAINAVFPERVDRELVKCERLLPHALVCVPWMEGEEQSTKASARLLAQAGTYLRERGQYTEAEPLLLRSLTIREQHLGPGHPDTATSLNCLANLYGEQGKYEQAEPLFQRALTIYEQQLGPQHPDTARSLNNLAVLYWQQGKYKQAGPLFQRALMIYEQQLGPQHPDTASCLNNLAFLYMQQGKYEQVESLYQRALAIREQQLGPQHPETACSLNNLAELYEQQGKYEQVESLYQRALAIWEQQLGPQHRDTASCLNNLASFYVRQGKYEQAEPLFQRVLTIYEQQLGPQHPRTAHPLHGLAVLYRDQGKSAEAESFFLRVLSIRECRLVSTHPYLAETLHEFAILRQAQGQYDEARSLYERALDARTQTLGAAHPHTIATHKRLAALLRNMGQIEEAVALEVMQPEQERTEKE